MTEVFHSLHFNGDVGSLAKFHSRACYRDTQNFDFSEFVPCPAEYQETVAEGARETRFIVAKIGFFLTDKPYNLLLGRDEYPLTHDHLWFSSRDEFASYLEEDEPETLKAAKACIEAERKHGFHDFYEWSRFHWGTPTEPIDTSLRRLDGGDLHVSFTTAVSPAIPVLKAIAHQYPLLKIKGFFYETELAFYGFVEGSDGLLNVEWLKGEPGYLGAPRARWSNL